MRLIAFGFAGALIAACSSSGGSSDATTTLATVGGPTTSTIGVAPVPVSAVNGSALVGGDFEASALTPWIGLPAPFQQPRLNRVARSGAQSAATPLGVPASLDGSAGNYIVQDLRTDRLPATLSGWYRVDTWAPAAGQQYLHVFVVAAGARDATLPNVPNLQLHYVLAGTPPQKRLTNAKYTVLSSRAPATGRWVRFELTPRADFARLWKRPATGVQWVRIAIGVRDDAHRAGTKPGEARVVWDDLQSS